MNANQTLSAECTVSERDYVVAHFVHLRPRPVAQYEDIYRLCLLRGPEGIIIALA
jgi:hypothetical protein